MTHRSGAKKANISAAGVALKLTPDEMRSVKAMGFTDDFQKALGYYTSSAFRNGVIGELMKAERAAVDFAKRQMTLNFGEKYESQITSFWDKVSAEGKTKDLYRS